MAEFETTLGWFDCNRSAACGWSVRRRHRPTGVAVFGPVSSQGQIRGDGVWKIIGDLAIEPTVKHISAPCRIVGLRDGSLVGNSLVAKCRCTAVGIEFDYMGIAAGYQAVCLED